MRDTRTIITTLDGHKYTCPPEDGVTNPQLWELRLSYRAIERDGRVTSQENGWYLAHVETERLVAATVLRPIRADAPVTQTVEDLIREIAVRVGLMIEE